MVLNRYRPVMRGLIVGFAIFRPVGLRFVADLRHDLFYRKLHRPGHIQKPLFFFRRRCFVFVLLIGRIFLGCFCFRFRGLALFRLSLWCFRGQFILGRGVFCHIGFIHSLLR